MECKTILPAKAWQAGVTLIELLMSMGVTAIAVGALVSVCLYSNTGTVGMKNYVDLDSAARQTLDTLAIDVRQSTNITTFTTNSIVITDPLVGPISYVWTPSTRVLVRQAAGETKAMLTECDQLAFSMYMATPLDGQLDLAPTTAVKDCKGIRVQWKCSRTVIGTKLNTENITSAIFVMRMQN